MTPEKSLPFESEAEALTTIKDAGLEVSKGIINIFTHEGYDNRVADAIEYLIGEWDYVVALYDRFHVDASHSSVGKTVLHSIYNNKCPVCGGTSISKVDMEPHWNCDNCKHRWVRSGNTSSNSSSSDDGKKVFTYPRNEMINNVPIRCYDNGGNDKIADERNNGSFDRYTVIYIQCLSKQNGKRMYDCRCMSEHPFHPQGFGQMSTCQAPEFDGDIDTHLGKRISFVDLPEDCQKLVMRDIADA